jgi:hypothetical protein
MIGLAGNQIYQSIAAIILAIGFYMALSSGQPVDAALAEARTAIYVGQLGAEWATPVLFMRAPAPESRFLSVRAGGQTEDPGIEPRKSRVPELLIFGFADFPRQTI